VRAFDTIEIWGRSSDKATHVVGELHAAGLTAACVAVDLDRSVAEADVISAVTGATDPLIKGALLRAGAHVDLIGGFTPSMREADDDVIRRASIYVDSRTDGVLAGDLSQPLDDGLISMDDIVGDLVQLIDGTSVGRIGDTQITLFKSAGIALEDVAAARLVFADDRPQTTG
jgi:ornithine cyclodeaminase